MGRLIVAVLVVALAWAGFWVFASTMLERGIRDYLGGPQEGVRIAAEDVAVRGFPNRLDTTLTGIAVTLPETGTVWRAPVAQILALVYRPTEVIAVLPPDHILETPVQTVELANERARASVALRASGDLALDRATLVIDESRATSSLGWSLGLRQARLSVAETATATYRLGLEGLDILSDGPLVGPAGIARVHLDATATFDRPWDRAALDAVPLPQVTALDVDDISTDWGPVSLVATGAVSVDANGTPEGRLDLKVSNWSAAFDALVDAGLLGGGFTPTLRLALAALADGDTLAVPLTFERGVMSLGPLPLGPAPDLTIR